MVPGSSPGPGAAWFQREIEQSKQHAAYLKQAPKMALGPTVALLFSENVGKSSLVTLQLYMSI